MQKISKNLVLKSVDSHLVLCLQSTGDYDYREFIQVENEGNLWCCIETDKFLLVEAEGIIKIKQEQTQVTIFTDEGEYRFPVMRERGIFMVEPEVSLPDGDPVKSWEYDFSGKNVSTKSISAVNIASSLIVIGENLVGRSMNHILEKYGDSSTASFSISPPVYALIQKLGKTKVSVYEDKLSFIGEDGTEIRVNGYRPAITIAQVEQNLLQGNKIATFDISKLKMKTMNKFILETTYLIFKTGSFSLVTESARKTVEIPELVLENPITVEMVANDLKYLTGEITLAETNLKGRDFYLLVSKDKDKTTYILLRPSLKTMTW